MGKYIYRMAISNGGVLSLIAVFIGITRTIATSERSKNKIIELITTKRWIVNMLIVILFCFYILYTTKYDTTKDAIAVKDALKKGIIALIIAQLAELGLTITPFWLVFVVAYYLEGWI